MTSVRLDPEAVQWREVQGEVVAVDLTNGHYLTVNPSGARLWPMLSDGTTMDALVKALVDRFRLNVEQARRDVEGFIGWLKEQNLLVAGEV